MYSFTTGTTMRGIYKGFKYTLSQFFVMKEREIEIGYPTDVKHVAHIGWEGSAGGAPSWMSHFKTGPDFATSSINSALSPWSSQDFGESKRLHSGSKIQEDESPTELPSVKKKVKPKKGRPTSSPTAISGASRSPRLSNPKADFFAGDAKRNSIEVA